MSAKVARRPRRKKWPTFATEAEAIAYERGREDMRAGVVKFIGRLRAMVRRGTAEDLTYRELARVIRSAGKERKVRKA